CALLGSMYADFGFPDCAAGLSTRPDVRAGSDELWDRAEAMLASAARAAELDPRAQPGEGTFYGPKLEFALRDRQGRDWQCGTIQLDFVLPERLDAGYFDSDGRRERPALLHHAVLGSMERFIGMLLEHHKGDLPLWLAPDQIVVANIGAAQADYAGHAAAELERSGLRAIADTRSERLARKILDAPPGRLPLLPAGR